MLPLGNDASIKQKIKIRTSPNNWNLAFSPRSTPAVVGPEFNPIRSDRFDVPFFNIKLRKRHNMASENMISPKI